MSDESKRFRQALGCYATGVAVITTAAPDGGACAITVNSFASVSLAPRLVLWSLGDQSDTYPVFSKAEMWGASVLGAEQGEIAQRFSKNARPNARAQELEMLGGAPVLKGALAAFGCRTHERRVLGDHLLIVGEVLGFNARAGGGLSFHRGAFGAIGAD